MGYKQDDPFRTGGITDRYTSTGRASGYQVEVWHDGLNEHRVLSDRDRGVLQNKVDAHRSRWAEKYKKRLEREAREAQRQAREAQRQAREAQRQSREAQRQSGLETAEMETEDAQAALQACRDILRHTLEVDDRVDWESLKSRAPMTREPKGTDGVEYDETTGRPVDYDPVPPPRGAAPVYSSPKLSLFDRLSSARRSRKEEEARALHDQARSQWQDKLDEVDRLDAARREAFAFEQQEWEAEVGEYKNRQEASNAAVDALKLSYEQWSGEDGRAIEAHAEIVLNASDYPDWIAIDLNSVTTQRRRRWSSSTSCPRKSRCRP